MLARDGNDQEPHRPGRSSAHHVGSYNANGSDHVQQTISGEGMSGRSSAPMCRTLWRQSATKMCTDCHLSKNDDNNAIMAQLLMQGTNYMNFIGRLLVGLTACAVSHRTGRTASRVRQQAAAPGVS